MRRNLTFVVLVLAVAFLADSWKGIWRTTAGEPAAPSAAPATAIGLVDLSKVFNVHTRFKRLSDALRGEVELAERELAASKAQLQASTDALAKLPKGSAEARQLESKISRDTAEVTVTINEQKKAFFEEEAAMYFETYQEIMAEVSKLADARGIGLVMRFNGDPYDANDPQAVQKELNKAILYHKGIDITDEIIALVNAKPEK